MMTVIDLGDVRLQRVLYADALVAGDSVGLTEDEVNSVAWGSPMWAQDGQVRAASCVWVVSGHGRNIAIDPSGNIDDILHEPQSTTAHQQAYAAAFSSAGIPIESVDTVLLSHIESVGLTAVRDGSGWRRFFPNSRVAISAAARSNFDAERPDGDVGLAFAALIQHSVVDTFDDGAELMPGLRAEWTGMHNPGHCAFHVGGSATFVGHLATSALHLATGPCAAQHFDADGAWRWLQTAAADGRILIGPLWPSPGALRVTAEGVEPVHG
jgi:hypothetical protein